MFIALDFLIFELLWRCEIYVVWTWVWLFLLSLIDWVLLVLIKWCLIYLFPWLFLSFEHAICFDLCRAYHTHCEMSSRHLRMFYGFWDIHCLWVVFGTHYWLMAYLIICLALCPRLFMICFKHTVTSWYA